MPLVPQTIDVPFEGGLDTSTDRKKVLSGRLLELENAVFDGSSISMRPGGAFLPDLKLGGGTLAQANALAVRGGELLRWAEDGIHGLANGAWVQRGDAADATPMQYDVVPVARRPYSCETFTTASLLGVTAYAWTEAEGSRRVLRATVVDDASGVRHQDAVELAADANGAQDWRILPRLVACGGSIVLLYAVAGSLGGIPLLARTLRPVAPQAFGAATSIATVNARSAGGPYEYPYEFDAVDRTTGVAGTNTVGVLAVVFSAVTGGLTLQQFSVAPGSPPVSTTPAAVTVTPSGPPAPNEYASVHLFGDASRTRLFVLLYNYADTTAQIHTFNAATHAAVATGAFSNGVSPFKVTALETSGVLTGYIEFRAPASGISTAKWSTSGAVLQTATFWVRSVSLGGQAFRLNGRDYVPTLYSNTWVGLGDQPGTQPTVFVLDGTTKRVVMRALVGLVAAPLSVAPVLAPAMVTSVGASMLLPVRGRGEFDTQSGIIEDLTAVGLARVTLRSAAPASVPPVEVDGSLHVGGSAPAMYDGAVWAEEGFHVRPEGVTTTTTTGGALSAGSYAWVVCYEWTDARGRLHRSAPSVPVSTTVSANALVKITVPYLHLTRKTGVRLALYRTIANGTVFYRTVDSRFSTVQPAVVPSNTVTIDDGETDASIQDNEVLPFGGPTGGSSGGELWHVPPSGYRFALLHGAYLFVLPMDDGNAVDYSLSVTDGEGVAFASELRLKVPGAHGAAVALATLDEKLIILCEQGVYVVFGEGPLRNGTGNGLTEPKYVTGSVGCTSAASVVAGPDGIAYKSDDGIFLLTRMLETARLGAGVEAYKGLTVVSAMQLPASKELRWYTQEGRTLVYSTKYAQWSTFTEQGATSVCVFAGAPHYATGLRIIREQDGSLLEGDAPFSMLVGTAWLKWGGFVGLERVWRVVLLGKLEPTTKVKAELFHDYIEAAPGSTHEQTYQGSSAGGPEVFNLRQTPGRQLCTALRARWTLTPQPIGPSDIGKISLTSLTLEVGVHPRASRRRQQSLGG